MAAEGAAGAAGAAVAAGLFGYNRANYLYDAEFRWERFSSAREYANQQAEQYRGDIRNLAALTVKKNTLWTVTATLNMALCVALYCAGRLGLHGPSPPAWIMGLWLTNNAASFAFMALCIFLAIHASFRAQAASTQLLTRNVRVPVPTLKQLDSARLFASEFEQQDWGDIFRVPYLSNNGAPKTDEAVYDDEPASGSAPKKGSRSSSAPPSRGGKSSSWVRKEFETDRDGLGASNLPEDAAPEHFQLYRAVQKEFYQHDIYARVCIFYGFIHYVQALCYYGLGHINIELRAFWTAYGCVFVIAVLMALLLRFDIVPANPGKKQYLPRCEFLGPLAILPAAIGMSLDFQVEFDPVSVSICWVLIFIAYILQLVYSLRMLEVMLPDEMFEGLAERFGASHLPEGWRKVPSSFYHVLYFVSPPDRLQPGQHDIVREVKEGGAGAYDEVMGADDARSPGGKKEAEGKAEHTSDDKAEEIRPLPNFSSDKHAEPWRLASTIAAVLPVCWCWLIFGCIIDVILGEQALVTAPHWSRPPMTRLSKRPHELGTPIGLPWPAGSHPWLPEQMAWHEEKRHAETTSFHRRLSNSSPEHLPSGADLAGALKTLLAAIPSAEISAEAPVAQEVAWPNFFEPRIVACGPSNKVAAITPRGFGAVVAPGDAASETFRLAGLVKPLISASWGEHAGAEGGLLGVTRDGGLLLCPGERPGAGAAWRCAAPADGLPAQLPVLEHGGILAAAAAMLPSEFAAEPRMHAAVVHASAPDLVALFVHEAQNWLPLGEVRMPETSVEGKATVSFVGSGDLLITTGHGHILRRRLSDGAVIASSTHSAHRLSKSSDEAEWQGACGLQEPSDDATPRLAHLRLRRTLGDAWHPELVTTAQAFELARRPEVFA